MSEIVFDIGFHPNDYIFMPACIYNGNRFDVKFHKYPPVFRPEEARLDMPTTITNVPRLNKDGSGFIDITTGDVSVPCVGVFSPAKSTGYLLFTVQEIDGKNLGLSYEAGKITVTYPAKRRLIYTMVTMNENTEEYVPLDAEIPHKFLEFECHSVTEFLRVFFENRKIMGLDDTLPTVLPREEQIRIQIEKRNRDNWLEDGQLYSVNYSNIAGGSKHSVWQAGWVGGAMDTYALLKLGGPLEKERAMKTLAHLFRYQGASGLFIGGCDRNLNKFGDGFDIENTEDWTLMRKSADCLYFVIRQFELMDKVPHDFEVGIKKCADRMVTVWQEYGQLGQFADVETGELIVGGSTSAGIAPAGLAVAYRYFGDSVYLEVAEAIAEKYYVDFVSRGYTTGGPGEILSCPDSESAFGLLESYVWLYDITKNEKYLGYAKDTAYLCSSWVVPYNYRFPKSCEFAKLDMKTVGSVFANVQNKHSAPGICTLSGTSLRKLYEWTGDEKFLTLYREIGETISQYMSTEDRPIMTNDRKIPAPSGYICERVNMSDWETHEWVGNIFYGSCWCEASNLLYLSDM